MRKISGAGALIVVFLSSLGLQARADTPRDADSAQKQYDQMVAQAIDYLAANGQAEDGSYSSFAGPGVTAAGYHWNSPPRQNAG